MIIMTVRKIKNNIPRKKPQPTVQHESSAYSNQNIGIDNPIQAKKENRNAASHRRKYNGSDGADQERGSNH
jgi:hypothetical protein